MQRSDAGQIGVATVCGGVGSLIVLALLPAVVAVAGVRPVTRTHAILCGAILVATSGCCGGVLRRRCDRQHAIAKVLLASPGTYLGLFFTAFVILGPTPVEGSFVYLLCLGCGPPLLSWTAVALGWRPWGVRPPRAASGSVRACTTCGYNLTGNESGVCPECGTAVPPAGL